MKKPQVIFRVDGNTQIGLGHVTRCLALAQMIREKFDCVFAIVQPDSAVEEQIRLIATQVIKLPVGTMESFANNLTGAEIVVLDGYQFTPADQKIIKIKGCKLVMIDDLNQQHFIADVVINHALTAKAAEYSTESYSIVLTGSDYILIRPEFLNSNSHTQRPQNFDSVFVCLGGADEKNLSRNITSMLSGIDSLKRINLLVGSAYKGDKEQLRSISFKVSVYQNISAEKVKELMGQSDVGIVSASGVAYECAATGMPFLTGYFTNNQVAFYHALIGQINVTGVGDLETLTATKLEAAIKILQINFNPASGGFIDGKQQQRYIHLFEQLSCH